MKSSKRSYDPFPLLLLVLSILLTWWLVTDRTSQIDTFQSPLPPANLSYQKTVNRTRAQVDDILTYNIIITNTGGPTTDTLVVDQLSTEVIWMNVVTSTYGTPGYDPSFRRIGWTGSLTSNATLVISWSVVVINVPFNPGNILTNSFISISDATAVATRFVETIISTRTPLPTATPTPTNTPTPTDTPSPTSTSTRTPIPTSTATPTNTSTPTATATPTNSPTNTPIVTLRPTMTPYLTLTPDPSVTITPTVPHPVNWPKYLPETGEK